MFSACKEGPLVVSRDLVVNHSVLLIAALWLCGAPACTPAERKADRKADRPGLWQPVVLGTEARLEAVDFPDPLNGWAVGGSHRVDGGLLGRSMDGGATWRWRSGIVPGSGLRGLLAVHALDADRAFAVSGSGHVLRTLDGGVHWHTVHVDARRTALTSLGFADADFGWAAGRGRLLVTQDAGETWSPVGSEERQEYAEWGSHVQFVDRKTAWSAGQHGALHVTRDRGRSWEQVPLPWPAGLSRRSFEALHFVDSDHGWIVGEEGLVFHTADGGASWVRQDTGQPDARTRPRLEVIRRQHGIDTVAAGDVDPGLLLTAVRFIDTRRGWLTGVYRGSTRSVVLATLDGGLTWSLEAEVEGEELLAIHVHADGRAWALGARTQPGEQLQLRTDR